MYLSKVTFDISNELVRKCTNDAQKMHFAVQNFFSSSRKDAGVLYRVDWDHNALYMQSKVIPDMRNRMLSGFTFHNMISLDENIKRLANGKRYRFDLLASPVKKIHIENKPRSIKVFLKDAQARMDWLNRKGEQGGFKVISVNENVCDFPKVNHPKSGVFKCPSVQFTGTLEVTDAEKFRKTYCEGIGLARAYGHGMLLLR